MTKYTQLHNLTFPSCCHYYCQDLSSCLLKTVLVHANIDLCQFMMYIFIKCQLPVVNCQFQVCKIDLMFLSVFLFCFCQSWLELTRATRLTLSLPVHQVLVLWQEDHPLSKCDLQQYAQLLQFTLRQAILCLLLHDLLVAQLRTWPHLILPLLLHTMEEEEEQSTQTKFSIRVQTSTYTCTRISVCSNQSHLQSRGQSSEDCTKKCKYVKEICSSYG